MMESCGICFKVRELPNDEWGYIAPELLPEWSDAEEQLLGRLRYGPPDAEATALYAFLHEGILRSYLSKLGEHARDAAIYWKYGCWLYEQTTRSQVLIESQWDDVESEAGAGAIRLRAWGENADSLIEPLLEALRRLPVGQAPKIEQTKRFPVHAVISSTASVFHRVGPTPPGAQSPDIVSRSGDAVSLSHVAAETQNRGLEQLEFPSRPELPPEDTPKIFVSFASGDDSCEEARKRTEVVEKLCITLEKQGWRIIRDTTAMRPGDLMSGFMKRLGRADRVIVVLSDKYLHSPYCMTELYDIYRRSIGVEDDFQSRVIPLTLEDAKIDHWEDRIAYTRFWAEEYKKMEADLPVLGPTSRELFNSMREWTFRMDEMLGFLSNKLGPRGFDEIVKDDFAALRKMLSQPSTPVRDAAQTSRSTKKSQEHLSETTETASSTIQQVVLLIHGIRDFAEWQDMVATVLSEIPTIEVCPLKYGRFDAFRFWFPLWTREAPVKNLLWRIRSAHHRFSPAKMSVVAHSFGTYAIGEILKENPDIRLNRLILCGSILPADFRWDKIQHSVEMPIINDCGIKDIWPVLAQSTTFGYGPSGRFGFGTPGVRDRYHDFGHGSFFQEKFVSDFWLPWFRSGNFVKSKAPPPSGARWHVLTIIQIKWLAILLCVLGIPWFALTNVPKGGNTLDTFQSIHPTLSWPYDATTFNAYPRSTTLRWLPVSGATHYLVQVQWENPTDGLWHTLPNYPVAVEEPSYTFNFVGAQPGRWQVAAVNAKNQNTQYSDWWYFKYEK